jgi:YD repeat-containing protein
MPGLDMRHESLGNLITMNNLLVRVDSYTYDTIGRVASHTDPKQNTTSLIRDGMGRITQVTYQDQSIKTYTYDCCVLTNVTDPNGTIVFVYDTLKRLQSLTDVYGKTISYA